MNGRDLLLGSVPKETPKERFADEPLDDSEMVGSLDLRHHSMFFSLSES